MSPVTKSASPLLYRNKLPRTKGSPPGTEKSLMVGTEQLPDTQEWDFPQLASNQPSILVMQDQPQEVSTLPSLNISSLSLYETIIWKCLLLSDDFKLYPKFLKRMATSLGILMEIMEENPHKLIDILYPAISGKVVLPVSEMIMQPIKSLWQTPSSIMPVAKGTECKYQVLSQTYRHFYQHLMPGS